MNDVLRILLVEDSEDDAELMRREILRGGYEPRFHRVADAGAMQRALDEQEWDLVISDYVMPGFSGLEALELFKRRNLDIPFLVVSGHIGEDRAVETMRAGADDYVMKDRLARLVPAITRELREAATRKGRREADRALRESEERLRESNRELSKSRAELEKRVLARTADLTAANSELQCQIHERMRLERDLLEVAEKERQRIGFDLHDDLSQQLMGVAFLVKALERKVANRGVPSEVEARQIQTLIDEVINHTHDLAHDFSSLDRQGDDLAAELTKLAAKVKKMFGVSCRFLRKGVAPQLPPNVVAHLYKIAQESASNAVKHGRAKEVSISLSKRGSELVLRVRNDGLPIPEDRKASDRMGLRIMNSRANLIGAALKIESSEEKGTVVTCTLPLKGVPKPKVMDVHNSAPLTNERARPISLAIVNAECAA